MSTTVTAAEVKKIAHLGRIGVSNEEISRATEQLSGVLESFSQIQKIDTSNVPTADDSTGLHNVVRLDTAQPEELCPTEALLTAAPEREGRQFKVKAVFE